MDINNLIKVAPVYKSLKNNLNLMSECIFDIKDQLALIYDRMVKDNFYLSVESYSALINAENILKSIQENDKRYNFDSRQLYLNQNGKIYVDTGLLIHIIDIVQRVNEQANKFLLETYFNSMKTEDTLNRMPFSCNSSRISLSSLNIKENYTVLPGIAKPMSNKQKNKIKEDDTAEVFRKCIDDLEAAKVALKKQQNYLQINPYSSKFNKKSFPVPDCLLQPSTKPVTKTIPEMRQSNLTSKISKVNPSGSESLLESPFEAFRDNIDNVDLFEDDRKQKKTFLKKFSTFFKRKTVPSFIHTTDCSDFTDIDDDSNDLNPKISKCNEIKSNETTNLLYTTVDGNSFCISIKIKPQYSQKASNSSPKHGCNTTPVKGNMVLEQKTDDLVRNQLSKMKNNRFRDRLIRQFSKLSIDNLIRIRKKSQYNKNDDNNGAILNAIFRRSRTFEEHSSLNTIQYKINNQSKYSTDYYISLGKSYDTSCSWILSTPQIYCCEIKCNHHVVELKNKFDFYINLTKDMHMYSFDENLIYEVRYFEIKKYFKRKESSSTNESCSYETEQKTPVNKYKQKLNKSEKNDKQTYLNIHKNNLERFKNLYKSTDESDESEPRSEEVYNHLLRNFKVGSMNKDFYVFQPTPVQVNTLFKARRKKPEYMLTRSKSMFSVSDFGSFSKINQKHVQSNERNLNPCTASIQNDAPNNKNTEFNQMTNQNSKKSNQDSISCKPVDNLKDFIFSQPNVEAGMDINDVDIKINKINKNLQCFEEKLNSISYKMQESHLKEECIQTENKNHSEYCQTNEQLLKNNLLNKDLNMLSLMDNDNLEKLILFLETIKKQFKDSNHKYEICDYDNLIRFQDTQYIDEIVQFSDEDCSQDIRENDYVVYQCTCDCSSHQSVFQRFWNKSKNVMPKCQRDYERSPSVHTRYQKSKSSLGCAYSCDFNHLCQNCGFYIRLKGCEPTPYTKFCTCLNKSSTHSRPASERVNKGTDPLMNVPDGVFCTLSSKNFNPCQCEDNTKICNAYKLQLCTCSEKFTSVGYQIEPEMEDRQIGTNRPLMEDATTQFFKIRKTTSLQTLTDCQCNNCAPKQDDEKCDCPTVVKCGSKSDVGINCDCPLTEKKHSASQADGDNKREKTEKSTEIEPKESKNKAETPSDISKSEFESKSKETDEESEFKE